MRSTDLRAPTDDPPAAVDLDALALPRLATVDSPFPAIVRCGWCGANGYGYRDGSRIVVDAWDHDNGCPMVLAYAALGRWRRLTAEATWPVP